MKRSLFLTIVAVISAGFGLGLLICPAAVLSQYGLTLDVAGILTARFLAAALIGQALLFWISRNVPDSVAMTGILWAGFAGNFIEGIVAKMAVRSGLMNSMGWSVVAMDMLIAIGFASYLFGKKPYPTVNP